MLGKSSDEIMRFFTVDPRAEHSLILQIKMQITWMIASQKLVEGDALPSMRELARYLNVNIHTVRAAYNRLEAEGLVEIRPRARARVLRYDPLCFASQAGRIRNHTIGIILPSISNPFYQSFLKGVQFVAEKNNTLTFICSTYDDETLAWRYYAQLVASGVDGAISVSHDMSGFIQSEEDALKIPLISADSPANFGYSVELDHENSGFLATKHLIQHGYRRIALVRYTVDTPAVQSIQRGYEAALQQAGLHVLSERIFNANGFDRVCGEVAAQGILNLAERPDAVFVIADQLAIGVIQAFQEAGGFVPQQIAVVSFNNIPEAAFTSPPLTSVAPPTEQLGETAMSMLNDLIAERIFKQKYVVLPCTGLVIRQSCGCDLP